jgi:glucose-6-phosphate 1-dehydrogenase
MQNPRSDAFVFFGATGDLAHKQIWPALFALLQAGRLDMPIIAIGRKDIGSDGIRKKARESLEQNGKFDEASFELLSKRLSYVAVDYDDPKSFEAIKRDLDDAHHPLSYVALPPDVFEKVAANLAHAGIADGARLVLEKPFAHDAASAKTLSEALYAFFPEQSIFRIDHYLGKEQVENIAYFRAANPVFESSWNREHVSAVEVTMAESFGVKGRAEFYDAVGALRDVVQNHLLEVVACLAMDLPIEPGRAALRAARSQVLSKVRQVSSEDVVRGQFRGYKDEQGVAANSTTETFVALRLYIDSPRWAAVPFYLRAGKGMAVSATDATVRLQAPGHAVLDDGHAPGANALRFKLSPGSGITLVCNVKTPGEALSGQTAELVLKQPDAAGSLLPYERLLGDAIDGDASMYAERRAVEHSWRIFDAVLQSKTAPVEYEQGSWGPDTAQSISPEGGWHNPAP